MEDIDKKKVDRHRLQELAKLTGRLAHEIKNPLSTIKVNLDLITEELDTLRKATTNSENTRRLERATRKINIIQKETDRLRLILDGLAKYTEPGRINPQPLDINEVVSDMVDFYMPKAQNNSVIMRQCLANEPLICNADEDMLKEVILNLFINALQAMDTTGGELTIRTDRRDKNVIIEISDTGRGIKPDKIDRIFEIYYSNRPGGSGLGLAMAKKIIELHKGKIKVDSLPGKGTQFKIEIPAKEK